MSQKAILQNGWSLMDHGLLWKEVVKSATDQTSFRKQAEDFVEQLQHAAKPKNALEGLLLDRMASSYLRKVMLLEENAGYKDHLRARARAESKSKGCTPEEIAKAVLLDTQPSNLLHSGSGYDAVMKYESDLDRGFHRDTFLLLQLQQLSEQGAALSPGKPAQSASKTIEGDIEKPAIG
jgi:hypothetical protein